MLIQFVITFSKRNVHELSSRRPWIREEVMVAGLAYTGVTSCPPALRHPPSQEGFQWDDERQCHLRCLYILVTKGVFQARWKHNTQSESWSLAITTRYPPSSGVSRHSAALSLSSGKPCPSFIFRQLMGPWVSHTRDDPRSAAWDWFPAGVAGYGALPALPYCSPQWKQLFCSQAVCMCIGTGGRGWVKTAPLRQWVWATSQSREFERRLTVSTGVSKNMHACGIHLNTCMFTRVCRVHLHVQHRVEGTTLEATHLASILSPVPDSQVTLVPFLILSLSGFFYCRTGIAMPSSKGFSTWSVQVKCLEQHLLYSKNSISVIYCCCFCGVSTCI